MIELIKLGGDKVSIDPKQIAALEPKSWGTRILIGGETFHVIEKYDEVMQKIKGNDLETK